MASSSRCAGSSGFVGALGSARARAQGIGRCGIYPAPGAEGIAAAGFSIVGEGKGGGPLFFFLGSGGGV